MDLRWQPLGQDSQRVVSVWHHPTATPLQLLAGTHSDGVNLTAYASRISHSASEASITLNWHQELSGAAQPRPGTLLELRLGSQLLWGGVIEALNDYRLSSGARTLTVLARSRDASPLWRDTRRVSALYPVATPLAAIARDIAISLGLTDSEIAFGDASAVTVHSNTQLADLTAWDMLATIGQPLGLTPFVSARGQLKTISRDITRPAAVTLSNAALVSVGAAKARPPLTLVRIKWLDPKLTKVSQQSQKLAAETITAGYFQINQKKHIAFSADETQRAENTYLVVKQSANSALAPVCEETYAQQTQTHGEILLKTSMWVPALLTAGIGAIIAGAFIPDAVVLEPPETIPIGRRIQAAAEIEVMLVMASIGTGMYEVGGTPYDFVHGRNRTEAYDDSAPAWLGNEQEIENDFVMDEAMAQAFAVRELIYQTRQAATYTVSIVDDPRLEPGDIIELPDATRLYITDYRRDLSPGAPAILELQGFRA